MGNTEEGFMIFERLQRMVMEAEHDKGVAI